MLIMIPVLKDVLPSLDVRALFLVVLALLAPGCAGGSADSERTALSPPSIRSRGRRSGSLPTRSTDVVNLTPPGAEPHDLELSPSDVETIRDAELVVYIGGGFQPALEDAVDLREGDSLDLLRGGEDPHIWLDPIRFAQAVRVDRPGGRRIRWTTRFAS